MARIKRTTEPECIESPPTRPAITFEGRENQLIALAVDCVEQRMRNGTASAQEYIHYLKLASTKERLEKEKLELELELVRAKTEALQAAQKNEALYAEAMAAFKRYTGHPDEDPDVY